MRWRSKRDDWKRHFAWLPIYVGSERMWFWLERYWMRSAGEYREVSLTDPALTDGSASDRVTADAEPGTGRLGHK